MPSNSKIACIAIAFLFFNAAMMAQTGRPMDHTSDYTTGPSKAPQHLTGKEKMTIAGSVCRPAMEELRTIISEGAIRCTGVLNGMGDAEDSPLDLVIFVHGDIFDGSDDAENVRHGILFVLGKYLKNDPEVTVLFFASENILYVVGAQTIIDQHDRILRGDENLKTAWDTIQRFTTKYETHEVGNGCPGPATETEMTPATEIKMMLLDPDLNGRWTFLKYDQCITEIKEAPRNKASDYAPRPAPPATPAHTATTFRGHTLGESWQNFIRTEEGLCQSNAKVCPQAESGARALLSQFTKDGQVIFTFEYARFAQAIVTVRDSSFVDLTYFEKTYGKPSFKFSHPEKGTAESHWFFSDGGEARAKESTVQTGEFRIMFTIQASDYALRPGPLASNLHTPTFKGHTLGENWLKFAQTGAGLCRLGKDSQVGEENAHACKEAAAGKDAKLIQESENGFIEAVFTFELGRLMNVDMNIDMPKFVELDYLDKTYGHPYYMTNDPEIDLATARWDFSDGGQVSATETVGVIMISAKTIPLH